MFSRRQSSAIEHSPRKPDRTILILSSVEYFFRVVRRMFFTCCSAASCGPDCCFIFAPLMGYDEPEILLKQKLSNVPHTLTGNSQRTGNIRTRQ